MARHRLFNFSLAALPLIATVALAQDTRQYQAWDRNDDGVITRAEWRGSLQEFRNLDWNLDGVLSGREVWVDSGRQPGSEVAEFASLDRNQNGRISRGEWRGGRSAFLRVDRNRDNQITRDEFLNANAASTVELTEDFDWLDADFSGRIERNEWTGTRPAFSRLDRDGDGRLTRRELALGDAARASTEDFDDAVEQTIVVDARQPWTHTGIHVNAGDVVRYRAAGSIEMSSGSDRATPTGALSGRTARNSPRPDQSAGALLLRTGNGPVAVIGDSGTFTVRESGQLSLGVNDDHFADNSGEYRVWLSIDPR